MEREVWITLVTGERRGPIYIDGSEDDPYVNSRDLLEAIYAGHEGDWLSFGYGSVRTSTVVEIFNVWPEDLNPARHPLSGRSG